jgi:hypothetical protein
MEKSKDQLMAEIRYAIRLTQRTARFYRHIQSLGTFLAILGGSATLATLSNSLPHWISLAGGALLAVAGAALIAIRPADKAAANESDYRRYQALMAKAPALDADALVTAIHEAQMGDAPEIESLRDIAYNDVMFEINRADCLIRLTLWQKILSGLA